MEFEIIEKGSTEGIAGNLICGDNCQCDYFCDTYCDIYCPGVCIGNCEINVLPIPMCFCDGASNCQCH